MIKKINDFSYKSYDNYTGPTEDFRAKNIIFGYNGSGKSTLVNGIEKEFLKNQVNNEQELRIYSYDYVEKKLLLDVANRRTLKGVKVTFGEQNIEIENEIKALEKKIVSEEDLDDLSTDINNFECEIREEIDEIFINRKGKLKIQKKSKSLSIDAVIEAYKVDYKAAIKYEKDLDSIEESISKDTIERKIIALESLYRPYTIVVYPKDIAHLETIQSSDYGDVQIPNSIIIAWLEEGVRIHENKNTCEFCGSHIDDYSEIINRITSYSKNKKLLAEKFYRFLKENLEDFIEGVNKIEEVTNLYFSLIRDIKEPISKLVEVKKKINEYSELVNDNIKNIENIKKIDVFEFGLIIKKGNEIAEIINSEISAALEKERIKLDKISILVKGTVYLDIMKSTLIRNCFLKIDEKAEEIKTAQNNNTTIAQQIEELKKDKMVTIDFMNLVNEVLRDLNISLELIIEGNDYIIKTRLLNQEELSIDDISEGEKNLLALLFFYFGMFEDKDQTQLKSDIKLVILDDPISSMDDYNRFYVLEIVKNIMNLSVDQVFVLTHVWDDFCQLIYGKDCFGKKSEYASYEIKKREKSEIIKNVSKGNPYKFMFKEIYELSRKRKLSSDCEYFHIPNTMRKVFEEFLFFKTNGILPQNSRKEYIEEKFEIITTKDKVKLGTLLTVINVLSHTNVKTNEDILTAAKFLMKIIEKNDKLHYDAMKE